MILIVVGSVGVIPIFKMVIPEFGTIESTCSTKKKKKQSWTEHMDVSPVFGNRWFLLQAVTREERGIPID